MIFENQHIAKEKIANLSDSEATTLNARIVELRDELSKLGEENSVVPYWTQSRFDFLIPEGKAEAYNEFIHYLITLSFIKKSPARAIEYLGDLLGTTTLGVKFVDFLRDEMGVYRASEDVLGKVEGETEGDSVAQGTTASAEFKENFQEQLLNAVTQDSGNRAQMVLDYFDNNLGPLVDEFGMDGTELVFDILTILSEKEKERLGETSTPEEKLNLDDLDFLDSDDEEFSLIDLEEDADEFEI